MLSGSFVLFAASVFGLGADEAQPCAADANLADANIARAITAALAAPKPAGILLFVDGPPLRVVDRGVPIPILVGPGGANSILDQAIIDALAAPKPAGILLHVDGARLRVIDRGAAKPILICPRGRHGDAAERKKKEN